MVRATSVKSEEPLAPLALVWEELNSYAVQLRSLHDQEPEDALNWLSSVSARVLELTFQTLHVNSRDNQKLRSEWLTPLKDELRFQFQVASRRVALTRMDFDTSGRQAY